jgi:hypothetical protein
MSPRYETIPAPRFVVESVDGAEQITIRAQRNIFLMLFLPVWLCGWTFGGVAAFTSLWTRGFQPFLLVWLCGWALGEIFVAATLCWMFSGAEILRVIGSDLEVGYQMLGLARRKLYRGGEIRDLTSWTAPIVGQRYRYQASLPFLTGAQSGAVKFNYGARTIYLAAGLDEPEGRLIVDRLKRGLPSSASERGDE